MEFVTSRTYLTLRQLNELEHNVASQWILSYAEFDGSNSGGHAGRDSALPIEVARVPAISTVLQH